MVGKGWLLRVVFGGLEALSEPRITRIFADGL